MRAAIDIGSNSLLLLVVDDEGKPLHDEAVVVGLGRGLGERGMFQPDRMAASMAVLARYAEVAAGLGVAPQDVRAVATSASRRALNAATFYANVRARTGLRVQVIPGDEEAHLTWKGGVADLAPRTGLVLLCDPGGGSTEIALGDGERVLFRTSLEVGTVRLTEAFLGYGRAEPGASARMRAHVDAAVAKVTLPAAPRVAIAVAGTATTLAANQLGLTTYEAAKVHGSKLTAAALRRWTDRLLGASPEERRALLKVSPERADTLLVGAVILQRVLELAKRPSWVVSDRGLRWALVA